MPATDYEIALATIADIAGMLELQEENQKSRGGTLSVALSRQWFEQDLAEMPIVVARNDGRVVGFVVSASFAAYAQVPIVKAMLRVYSGSDGAYLYGPICVARAERGRGLAARMFAALRMQLRGREGILFIRRDNDASMRAHLKMGMHEVGEFTYHNAIHAILAYKS